MGTKIQAYMRPKLVIDCETIDWKKQITYLGVKINRFLMLSPQIEMAAKKISKVMEQLTILMLNVDWPGMKKQRLFLSVMKTQMLYDAPIWSVNLRP